MALSRPVDRPTMMDRMDLRTARATRGSGLLEPVLSSWRGRRADACIPHDLRAGRLLDVGCGAGARFVRETAFAEKHAVDQLASRETWADVHYRQVDLDASVTLPYPERHFQAVTMLAVVEHLAPVAVPYVFHEVYRVLALDGVFVLTTPAPWSDPLLRWMARVGLVSSTEIDEHQNVMGRVELVDALAQAGFGRVESGYFEAGLNMWARAAR